MYYSTPALQHYSVRAWRQGPDRGLGLQWTWHLFEFSGCNSLVSWGGRHSSSYDWDDWGWAEWTEYGVVARALDKSMHLESLLVASIPSGPSVSCRGLVPPVPAVPAVPAVPLGGGGDGGDGGNSSHPLLALLVLLALSCPSYPPCPRHPAVRAWSCVLLGPVPANRYIAVEDWIAA